MIPSVCLNFIAIFQAKSNEHFMRTNQLLAGFLLIFLFSINTYAQETTSEGYLFTEKKVLPHTPVKDQYRTGTCWSFAGTSFIESEMLRLGKPELDLSEMFLVYNCYKDKAGRYVRMQGNTNFGSGGLLHDILYIIKNYGLVPESVYSGIAYGEKKHVHGEFDNLLKSEVDAIIQNKNKKISPVWPGIVQETLDSYLGKIPDTFEYQGKTYTPKTFAAEYCSVINPDDYIEITSFSHHPFYQQFILEVPDNWLWEKMYNVPLDELQEIVDNALENGFTVGWAADTSEKGFSTSKKGGAADLTFNKEEISDAEIAKWETPSDSEKKNNPDKPDTERLITQELRQAAFDSQETTDDHAMHIIGTAVDQTGAPFYKVKNSWGAYNSYDGFFYASIPYIRHKTTAIMVHKNAIPEKIRKKLGI
jgi:bleomycin hydrolase